MEGAPRRYSLNVPRYTSYPTAADFTSLVAAREHAAWLSNLDTRESVSIYLHVPYRREICFYCGCNTKMAARNDVIARYRSALEAEIDMVASLIKGGFGIARLHWGGGTPSILAANGLRSAGFSHFKQSAIDVDQSVRSERVLPIGVQFPRKIMP